ncbi:MAG TPA: TIGR01777 family protein [Nitrospirae bacterium]|nr:TIGR01777 family protein [Nitrospirota bacterium]
MRVAISGAGGFVGTHLRAGFAARGWESIALSRESYHQPSALKDALEGTDSVVNLAGANIIHRWTSKYKKTMYSSRVDTTNALVHASAACNKKPGVFISASAVGIYAPGGPHTESNYILNKGFLGALAVDWEAAALRARDAGIRTVIFRFGVVLGRNGGALRHMLPAFKMGLGGTIGDGSQPFPWVCIKDLQGAVERALTDSSMNGIYNLTAPALDTNTTLTKQLAKALHRPAFLRVPYIATRLRFGDGAQIITEGQSVIPERLMKEGFSFKFTKLKDAIEDCLI